MKQKLNYLMTAKGQEKKQQHLRATMMRRVSWFIYFGGPGGNPKATPQTRRRVDRIVRMYQNQKGTWTVDVEGMPELTQSWDTRDEAVAAFKSFREMARKDWEATEIHW